MLWLVLLPFGLLFAVVFGILALPLALVVAPLALLFAIPILILKFLFRLAAGLIVLSVLIIGGVLAVLLFGAVLAAMLVPAVPIAFILLGAWLLLRPRYSPV